MDKTRQELVEKPVEDTAGYDVVETEDSLEEDLDSKLDSEYYKQVFLALCYRGFRYLTFSYAIGMVWAIGSIMIFVMEKILLQDAILPPIFPVVEAAVILGTSLGELSFLDLTLVIFSVEIVLIAMAVWLYLNYKFSIDMRAAYNISRIANSGLPSLSVGLSGYLTLLSSSLIVVGLFTLVYQFGLLLFISGLFIFIVANMIISGLLSSTISLAGKKYRKGPMLMLAGSILHATSIVLGTLNAGGFLLQLLGMVYSVKTLRGELVRNLGEDAIQEVEALEKILA